MSRSDKEVIELIKDLIESRIQPAVSSHGACSGCAGSTMTLKYGIENIVKHYLPEVTSVEAIHDENSSVEPYYKDTQNVINTKEI
jgi:Fe-S cluster biogenesis protein NfuA